MQQAITDFWAWWADFATEAAELLRTGNTERFAEEITPRVQAIHPELGWGTAPPATAEHALVVSCGGASDLRATAERWLRAGPPTDELWEFYAARQPEPEMLGITLQMNDHELDLSHVLIQAKYQAPQARLDVSVYHPDFAFIPEEDRLEVGLLVLNWALGEDDVARWVGAVHLAEDEPLDPIPTTALRGVVESLESRFAEPLWLPLTGQTLNGDPVKAMTRFPLKSTDFPLYDQYVLVSLPYEPTDDGQPDEATDGKLSEYEQQLGIDADDDAVLVAHDTAGGQRNLHYYADAESDVAGLFRATVYDWPDGGAEVRTAEDPGWEQIQPFTTAF